MAGYTRQSSASILSGEIVSAAPINAEYNQIESAFNASTGHKHDGTTAEGPPIDRIADADQNNKVLIDTSNNHIEFYVDTGASTQQLRIQDGAIVPITDNDIDLGTASLEFKDLYVDGTANLDTVDIDAGNIDGTIIGASSAAAGTFTNLTASGTVNFTGATITNGGTFSTIDINGGTIDGTVVGGTSAAAGTFTTLTGATVNGTTSITTPSLTATSAVNFSGATVSNLGTVTTANIDGGTIDGTVVGGTSAAAGTFTNLTASGTVNLTGATVSNGGSVTTVDINGGTIDNTVIGGATPAAGTFSSLVATTADINAGTVDNTVVGGTTPAAGTFSSLVATTADINAGTIDNTVIGGTTPAAGSFTTITSSSNGTVGGNLTVTGDLTVNGTTTTVNSTTTTVDDPIVTLGGDTAPVADDNKDRGVEFRWHNGSAAKTGFFGYDDSTGYFTFIPDGTNTSEVYSGTLGTVEVGGVRLGGTTQTTAYIPSSVAITGGTINGTTVGGTSAAAGTFSSLVATTADINAGTIDGTTIGGTSAAAGTFSSLVATTADINAGTIDGVTVGGTSAAAGTFTDLTATGTVGLGSSVTISGGSVTGITDLAVADGGTGASTASAARTNLGLAIGSNVQAYDAGLQSISGLTTAADKMIYTTASDTYAVTNLTAAGRALIDDADASAQRTTLGLGTIATQNANNVNITGGSITGITTFAVGSSVKFELDTTTAEADPGSGKFRFNNTNQNTATELYIDDLDDAGTNIETWIQGFSLSTSVVTKGLLYIREEQVPNNFLAFKVTAVSNETGYTKLTVSNVASSATSPFANTDKLLVAYSLTGDKGDAGSLTGPGSSTDNAIVRYDGVGGNLTQDSSVLIADDGSMIISGSSSGNMLRITQTGAGNALVVEDSANPDSTPFVVDASGNTGIGTSAPSVPLHISSATPSMRLTDTDDNSDAQIGAAAGGLLVFDADINNEAVGSAILFRVDGGSEKMRLDSSGRVGIGTSSPSQRFVVSENQDSVVHIDAQNIDTGASAGAYLRMVTQNAAASGVIASGLLKYRSGELRLINGETGSTGIATFYTAGSERLRIDSSGNLLVGTTSGTNKLTVNGSAALTGGNGTYLSWDPAGNSQYVKLDTTLNGLKINGYAGLVFETGAGTERARIDASGDVFVGTTTDHNGRVSIKSTSTEQHLVLEQENVAYAGWGLRNYGAGGGDFEISRMSGTTTFTPIVTISGTTGAPTFTQSVNSSVTYLTQTNNGTASGTGLKVTAQSGAYVGKFDIAAAGAIARIGSETNHPLTIITNNTERARIDSSGRVGIGRTPTTNLLEVAGTIESTTGGFKFPDGSTQTKSAGHGLSAMIALGMA